jgi:signal transduction histidine kinase
MKTLKDFAIYLKEQRLKDYAVYYLSVIKGMDIPILKLVIEKGLIKDFSDEYAIKMTMDSQAKFLTSLVDGSALANSKISLKMWEEDKMPGIGRNDIMPADLVLIYAAQKKAIFHLLPDYTTDSKESIAIVQELEDFYTQTQNDASQLLFKIQKETEMLVKQLNEDLNRSLHELEIVNKELESFSYSVSHDLRAPLRAIRGYTKILQEDYGSNLDEEAQKLLNSVAGNAERMSQLIDDLLAFSRMGKKELNIGRVNMTEVAKSSLEVLKMSQNNTIKTKVTINELLPTIADHALMGNVLTNLLSNAIKYSGKTENPKVEIGSESKDGENIYWVKDNGVGFDMKYYDKLFGVFQRLHSFAEFDGTGVGLALVKRIVTRHGGRVWAEAEPGKGATFYIALQSMKP